MVLRFAHTHHTDERCERQNDQCEEAEREEDRAIEEDAKKGIVRKRKSIQQNLDAGARPIPGRANPNDVEQ